VPARCLTPWQSGTGRGGRAHPAKRWRRAASRGGAAARRPRFVPSLRTQRVGWPTARRSAALTRSSLQAAGPDVRRVSLQDEDDIIVGKTGQARACLAAPSAPLPDAIRQRWSVNLFPGMGPPQVLSAALSYLQSLPATSSADGVAASGADGEEAGEVPSASEKLGVRPPFRPDVSSSMKLLDAKICAQSAQGS
jgi:hypothetical protein